MKGNFLNYRMFDAKGDGYTSCYKDEDGDWVEYITPKGKAKIAETLSNLLNSEPTPEVSDTTDDPSSNSAD